jgi:carbonic anhydrase
MIRAHLALAFQSVFGYNAPSPIFTRMRSYSLPTVILLTVLVFAGCTEREEAPAVEAEDAVAPPEAPAVEGAAWSYEGRTGPEAWGTLGDAYRACSEGIAQSPIDLDSESAERADLARLTFDYGRANLTVRDSGHGFKATPGEGHTLRVAGASYRLLQLHPHTPSEHTLNGMHYPMEVHFVHQNDAGDLAVVGVMIEEGDENLAFQSFVDASATRQERAVRAENLDAMLPADRSYFTYEGSLTTPPCSEGVRWIVLREPVALSATQIAVFSEAHRRTNRPVQELNDRVVRVSN